MFDISRDIPVFPVYRYDKSDFHFKILENSLQNSKFDSILMEKWSEAEQRGIMKYTLNIQEKELKGQYKFVAQLNIDRSTLRRKAENVTSMLQPFDPNKFNFTKISKEEICFDVGNGNGSDIVAVNVSPIVYGHSLFIPQRYSNLPQRVTEYSLRKVLELLLLSNSIDMRVLFNSLCAYASVNHLHWHLYYLKHRMLLEQITVEHLKGPVHVLKDFPAKGFCVKLSSIAENNLNKFIQYSFTIIDFLQKSEIAHNIYITRAKSKNNEKSFDDVRIYIWARTPSFGIKDALCTSTFIPAVCELFGHLPLGTVEGYQSITEETVAKILSAITEDTFLSVKDKISEIIDVKISELNDQSEYY